MMKIAFVIGHHENAKGYYSKYHKVSEWDFFKDASTLIKGADIIFHDKNISGYVTRIKNTAEKYLDPNNYDLVIEAHFNAYKDEQANGCETFYYFKNKRTKELARDFSSLVNKRTNIKIRESGAKALSNTKDRGYASVYWPKADTILIEPFFGSNKSDCEKISNAGYCAMIINEFIEILNR